VGEGESLYEVDERLLERIGPTHILTQALCQVCAPSGNEITRALAALPVKPEVVWFTPSCLEDILANIRELGTVTGTTEQAERLIAASRARLARVAESTRSVLRRPRVLFLEWIDPYFCAGHWVPEMIELAGGEDALGRKGADSVRIALDQVREWAPEILIVSPCGFGLDAAYEQAVQLLRQPGLSELPAVRDGRVFAVNADAYYARPGPRVVEGTELLAHLIHPERGEWRGERGAFRRVPMAASRR
jgi:iron complex transport system substrate-binding protein